MTREQGILASLIAQGAIIPCFRCRIAFTPADKVEKEHLHERALGGPDVPGNWRWSHKECHAIVTNGTKATSAGSSKHRIAKAGRIARGKEPSRHKWPKGRKIPSRPW